MRPTRAAVTRQAGQALALGLALMALAGMAWLALYGLGQRAGARAQLLRATDAAAYSGAVVQARALNLLAYIHRAQVGHQVALAHLASLAAWARFAQTQAARRTAQNPPVALIGLLFGPRAARGYGAAHDALAGDLMQAYAAHDELAHRVLQQAADTLARDARATRDAIMRAVLRAHYPQGDDGLTLEVLRDDWPGYLRRVPGTSARGLRGWAQRAAGYFDFLQPRDFTREGNWIVSPRCPTRRHELRRRGVTWLDRDGRWGASDTLSFHAVRSNRWIGCYFREYAMGWGLAADSGATRAGPHVLRAPEDFSQQDFWRWVHRHTSWNLLGGRHNPLALSYAASRRLSPGGRGLPAVYEPASSSEAAVGFEIRTQRREEGIVLSARAAGQSHFSLPPGTSVARGRPDVLFLPYWQARRAAADAALPMAARRTVRGPESRP
ncbi:hypothetical protein [Bordetella bronchiseptica]|uniref:hypothetical protein n=1 Tax=Bordetella bronchiseptica TaxID=518 RepID=UPI000D72DC42|nr:hypothetical protein [Bordetella bronchiseptica]AWP80593.1 hypothetical protein B7P04_15280 [Bordetella bronchiseptica]SUW06806.1 pilus assembly protein [Bordetella bronchiseptica]VEI26561.1 pilus assembly protein [Bordetella bronchiseptica]